MSTAKVGLPAPDFTAPVYDPTGELSLGHKISLTDYRGKWVVFFWYPLDFTFVCPTEITALSDRYEDFLDLDTEIVGASTDSVHSHKAWANTPRDRNGIEGVRYPIISDMLHTIAADYGVLVDAEGIALRGLFIIDPEGILQYATINNLNIGRSVDETLRVLQALQTGGLCPSDWKPGQKDPGLSVKKGFVMPLRIGMEMPSLEGATEWINGQISTEELKGAPTLIQFWALSCHICKDNMPTIAAWKEKYDDLKFVSVHMPRQESDTDIAAVKAVIEQFGIDEPCAVDNEHVLGDQFQTSGYWPYYFLFDAEGKMKSRAAGDAGLGMIETAIKRLTAEAAAELVAA